MSANKCTILLVCDRANYLSLYRWLYEHSGYEVRLALLGQSDNNKIAPHTVLQDLVASRTSLSAVVIADQSIDQNTLGNLHDYWKLLAEERESVERRAQHNLSQIGIQVESDEPTQESILLEEVQDAFQRGTQTYIAEQHAAIDAAKDALAEQMMDLRTLSGSVDLIKTLRAEDSPFKSVPIIMDQVFPLRGQEFIEIGATVVRTSDANMGIHDIVLNLLAAKNARPEITFEAAALGSLANVQGVHIRASGVEL